MQPTTKHHVHSIKEQQLKLQLLLHSLIIGNGLVTLQQYKVTEGRFLVNVTSATEDVSLQYTSEQQEQYIDSIRSDK